MAESARGRRAERRREMSLTGFHSGQSREGICAPTIVAGVERLEELYARDSV
jgi:hypothetical protein